MSDAIWQALPKRLARGEAAAVADWAPARVIDALQRLCHDLVRRAHGQVGQFFAAASLPAVKRAGPLLSWESELRRAARHADHPLNANLWIEALVAQARSAIAAAGR